MKPLSSLLPKIQRVKKVKGQEALFKPDFSLLNRQLCPKCLRKLYLTRNAKLFYCRRKLCGFAIPSTTYNEIISGKRLQDYKDHVKMMGR